MTITVNTLTECLLCAHSKPDNTPLCSECLSTLPFALSPCLRCGIELLASPSTPICGQCLHSPPNIDYCHPALRYHFPVPSLVSRYKDHAQFAEGRLLALLLADSIRTHTVFNPPPSLIISVPLHPRRIRRRGFNQSEVIAHTVARQCGIRHSSGLCARTVNTPTQRGLDKSARQRNLRGAFSINPRKRRNIHDQHIAIVDDVVTTTSTVNALARELKLAGASSVGVFCLARVDKPGF